MSLRNPAYAVRLTWTCLVLAVIGALTASAAPEKAASPSDAINKYWAAVKAGKVDDAVGSYIDTSALVDLAAASDASITREQRASAAKDLQGFLGVAWKQPEVANAIRTSELKVKSEKPAGDGTTAVEYVVTLEKPQHTELPNTAYMTKGPDGWRIVDMKQADGPRMSETLRSGYIGAHQKLPSLTFDQFVNMMTSTLNRKASGGRRAATKPAPAR
jgi:ABC-type transporter MlaC component